MSMADEEYVEELCKEILPSSSQLRSWLRKENKKLKSQVEFLKKKIKRLEKLHLPCPDCRDKVEEGVCLRCEVQRLERELEYVNSGLKEPDYLLGGL